MTTRVQGGRTATPASPPANNSLQPGELYVEMASPLRLWTGVPTAVTASGVKLIVDATAQAAANGAAVQKAGDTMTGPLVLSGSPTQPNQAANKAYADTKVATVAGHPGPDVVLTHTDISDWTPTLALYALLASPPFSGTPTAPTPTIGDSSTKLSTTAFVANALAAQPGTVIAPTTPAFKAGQLWWDATGGSLYVGYDDGSTQQYVPATNITLPANAATKTDVGTALNNVGRNLIHNSAFTVAQRGAGNFTSGYTADRWQMSRGTGGGLANVNISAISDASRVQIGDEAAAWQLNYTNTAGAGASDVDVIQQLIEGVSRLAGKTVIVSFWAFAGAALKLGVAISQHFGTGGSPSTPVVVNGQTVNVTNVWQRYNVTLTLPSIAGKTLGTNKDDRTVLQLWMSAGSTYTANSGGVGVQSGSFSYWGVQLEIAQPGQTQPTPLEKRDPVLELQQCQRFYQFHPAVTIFSFGPAASNWVMDFSLPTTMRAAPNPVTLTNVSYSNASNMTLYSASASHVKLQSTLISTAGPGAAFGDMALSADL